MLQNNYRILSAFGRQLAVITRAYAITKQKSKTTGSVIADEPNDEITFEEPLNPNYFMRVIGSQYKNWNIVLQKYPELRTVKRKDIANSWQTLKHLNFEVADVLKKPMLLYYNALTLANRHNVLKEIGFQKVTASMLAKYVTVMNKTVTYHKSYGHILFEVNVVEKLQNCFTDLSIDIPNDGSCNENLELKVLRERILNYYLQQRLDMTKGDIEKMWKVYGRVRHKSFKSVQAVIKILLDDLEFPKERIVKNAYLLYSDAENVERILKEIPLLDDQDIRSIVFRRPKILMSSCNSLKKTLQHVKTYGIAEQAILRCLEVLTLGPDTVLERLRDLHEIEEFQVLGTNPRILRLVHYQNKARLRLDYLNQLKVRCASLHILSCGSRTFAKFARDGSDRTKGRDIVVYLANAMDKDEHSLRSMLSRHPNWCHTPVIQIKQCYDFLRSKKFSIDDIYYNIHLLLYPITRIGEKIVLLHSPEFLENVKINVNLYRLSNREILTLILYFIESDFHFTGDGIWTEQHGQHVENFKNLLPDFPESLNKVYKYGVKPASNTSAETALQS